MEENTFTEASQKVALKSNDWLKGVCKHPLNLWLTTSLQFALVFIAFTT